MAKSVKNIEGFTSLEVINELLRRKARSSFWAFCLYYDPGFFANRAQVLRPIAEAMQRVFDAHTRRVTRRLAISLPPGAGKTYLATLASAWMVGNEPEGSVMRNTSTAKFYIEFSRATRNVVRSRRYTDVFPEIKMARGNSAVTQWSITSSKQYAYVGGGVGGQITGLRCSICAITDDLFQGHEDGISPASQERVLEWYLADHLTRTMGGVDDSPTYAGVIDIGTRWSPNDVIGTMSAKGFYDEIISVPALTDEGKSYCEASISTAELLFKRETTTSEIWSATYMQNPIAGSGLLFPIRELAFASPADIGHCRVLTRIATLDPADAGGDNFAGVFADVVEWGDGIRIYVRDAMCVKDGLEAACVMAREKILSNKTERCFLEKNGIGLAAYMLLADIERVEAYTSSKNKLIKILSNYEFIKKYYIFDENYKQNLSYSKFIDNLCAFTRDGKGQNDDAPDVLAAHADVIKLIYGGLIYGTF